MEQSETAPFKPGATRVKSWMSNVEFNDMRRSLDNSLHFLVEECKDTDDTYFLVIAAILLQIQSAVALGDPAPAIRMMNAMKEVYEGDVSFSVDITQQPVNMSCLGPVAITTPWAIIGVEIECPGMRHESSERRDRVSVARSFEDDGLGDAETVRLPTRIRTLQGLYACLRQGVGAGEGLGIG